MKNAILMTVSALALALSTAAVQAEPRKDCLMEGTVHKSDTSDKSMNVQFHSMEKFDEKSRCRVRSGEKLEFQLPSDPRVINAPDGSSVKYRYQENRDGTVETQLISVGA